MELKDRYTTGDLARELDVSTEQAKRLFNDAAERGLIQVDRVGRYRVISQADMLTLLDERKAASQEKNVFGQGWPKGKPRK